jgi:Zn finger protein HypA/HybF involved in hydrogenase expression
MFRTSLEMWLARNGLDQDSHFYTAEEWHGRGEDLLRDAQFILVTEGGLHFLLNYNFAHPKVEEFRDLCESFGYWFELGHTWSVGFYRLEKADVTPTSGSYCQKLRDGRWKKKAALVKQRAQKKCEDCGSTRQPLHAHHCWYSYGLEPWQYPLDAFRCLCSTCHSARPRIEHHLRAIMARYTQAELVTLREAVDQLFHWYERDAALEFLKAVGPNDRKLREALSNLAKFKTEPGSTA